MDESLSVDGGQSPQHRNHHVECVLYGHLPAAARDVGLKTDTLDVVHDEIGRAVFVKVAGHTGDIRVAHELGQSPGLLLEPLGAVGKFLRFAFHGNGHGGADAGGNVVGHELFDSYFRVQLGVQGQIRVAETALAQHPADDVASAKSNPQWGQGPSPSGFSWKQL